MNNCQEKVNLIGTIIVIKLQLITELYTDIKLHITANHSTFYFAEIQSTIMYIPHHKQTFSS